MEQNGESPRCRSKCFQTAEIFEKNRIRHCDHKLTAYIVADMRPNCNTFPKKFQNSSLFIMIRHEVKSIGVISQKTAFFSKILFYPLKSSFFRSVRISKTPNKNHGVRASVRVSKKRQSKPTEKQKSESPSPASSKK